MTTAKLGRLSFQQAAGEWLETRKPYLAASTHHDYQKYIRTVSVFFSEMLLTEITADQIRAYQRSRLLRAQAGIVNKECSVLQQLLKRIGRWPELASDYQALPMRKESPGRCISDSEEARFFRAGLSNRNWCVAAWSSLISINTTAGPGEILHLRICDVDVAQATMRVSAEGVKNPNRVRVIPLNDAALEAVKSFLERARKLGACLPEHYLIPFYLGPGQYDPTKPQTHYYRALNEILAAADLDFRPYDCRHTAITRLLEAGVPEETVISMAGHAGRAMLKRYSDIRLEAKRTAVMALQRGRQS
jgi:integrase